MARRLFLVGLMAVSLACKSGGTGTSRVSGGQQATASEPGRDAIENALLSLGIDGRLMRVDLNSGREAKDRLRVAQAALMNELMLLETDEAEPRLYALDREGLRPRWVSALVEPTVYPPAENTDTFVLVSKHYATALDQTTGRRSIEFMGGALEGLSQPPLKLPFTPTGGAALGNDTFYLPSLGSIANNKNLESFSLLVGARGWGYRASGDLLTTPESAGGRADPKIYFVTKTGLVTCMDAKNYAYAPRGPRWEEFLEAAVDFGLSVTEDVKERAGSVYVVDREGVVYCLNRITGERRWIHATGQRPLGKPQVFGNLCVVRMARGLCGFDADNVVYELTVAGGNEAGTRWVRSGGGAVTVGGISFRVEGEVLRATAEGEGQLRVNDGAPKKSASAHSGAKVTRGNTTVTVRDRGSAPYWTGLDYDAVVGRVADDLLVRKGDVLTRIDAWSGEAGASAKLPGARLFPANRTDANLFVVGGDGVVYALYPR